MKSLKSTISFLTLDLCHTACIIIQENLRLCNMGYSRSVSQKTIVNWCAYWCPFMCISTNHLCINNKGKCGW